MLERRPPPHAPSHAGAAKRRTRGSGPCAPPRPCFHPKNLFLLDRGRPRRPQVGAAGGGWGGWSEPPGTQHPCTRASVCALKGVGLAAAIPANAEGAAPCSKGVAVAF